MRWEWTFDADRSGFEALVGSFLLSAVTAGGFFLAAPVLGWILRWIGLFRTGIDEVLTLGAVVLLTGAGAVLHRSELPLRSLRARLEQEVGSPRLETLARVMKGLSALARPEGGLGHVGGIGAGWLAWSTPRERWRP